MKNKIFKTLAVFGLSFIAWNCSEDPASSQQPNTDASVPTSRAAFDVETDCWMIAVGNTIYLIVPTGIVTDVYSNPVGTYDATKGVVSDVSGNAIIANVNLSSLAIVHPDGTVTYPDGSIKTVDGVVVYDPSTANSNGSTTTPITASSSSVTTKPITASSSSANSQQPKPSVSSSSQKVEQPAVSSSSKPVESSNGNSGTISGALTQTVAQGSAIATVTVSGVNSQPTRQTWNTWFIQDSDCKYDANAKTFTISGTVPEGFQTGSVSESWSADGMTFTLTLNVTAKNGSQEETKKSSSSQQQAKSSSSQQQQPKSSSSQQQPKSSSSQPKSSSSAPQSSSSQTQSNPNAGAEEAKYLNAGAGGQQGFATRYWDCCMPHCAWPEHGGAAKTCDAKGKTPIGNTNGSICSGGQGTTCTSQIPIIVSDKLAYAFAATPGNDATCGKCFALTFTGTGKYETKANHQALKGKTLVVMASNIGYDVQGGQFDIMIPGGGVGLYNGCAGMGWGSQGATYGGLLSECESEVGYNGDLLTKRKQCLTEKCNKSFANDTQAKEGCLFLATWMEAAGNPNHTYKEVECPSALKAQF